jgi:hypothetical protein
MYYCIELEHILHIIHVFAWGRLIEVVVYEHCQDFVSQALGIKQILRSYILAIYQIANLTLIGKQMSYCSIHGNFDIFHTIRSSLNRL